MTTLRVIWRFRGREKSTQTSHRGLKPHCGCIACVLFICASGVFGYLQYLVTLFTWLCCHGWLWDSKFTPVRPNETYVEVGKLVFWITTLYLLWFLLSDINLEHPHEAGVEGLGSPFIERTQTSLLTAWTPPGGLGIEKIEKIENIRVPAGPIFSIFSFFSIQGTGLPPPPPWGRLMGSPKPQYFQFFQFFNSFN